METTVAQKRRPDFLTILCVLTFIGSGLGILNNLTIYNNAAVQAEMTKRMVEEQKEQAMEKAKSAGERSMLEKLFSGSGQLMDTRKIKQSSLFMLMSNILTLIGGMLMFRLKKQGFGFYLLGTAVSIAAPLLIYWSGGLFGQLLTIVTGLVGVLFVILYYLNIKYMS